MTDPREGLRECPFCGGEAKVVYHEPGCGYGQTHVECVECGAEAGHQFGKEPEAELCTAAEKAWSQRAVAPANEGLRVEAEDGEGWKVIVDGAETVTDLIEALRDYEGMPNPVRVAAPLTDEEQRGLERCLTVLRNHDEDAAGEWVNDVTGQDPTRREFLVGVEWIAKRLSETEGGEG